MNGVAKPRPRCQTQAPRPDKVCSRPVLVRLRRSADSRFGASIRLRSRPAPIAPQEAPPSGLTLVARQPRPEQAA